MISLRVSLLVQTCLWVDLWANRCWYLSLSEPLPLSRCRHIPFWMILPPDDVRGSTWNPQTNIWTIVKCWHRCVMVSNRSLWLLWMSQDNSSCSRFHRKHYWLSYKRGSFHQGLACSSLHRLWWRCDWSPFRLVCQSLKFTQNFTYWVNFTQRINFILWVTQGLILHVE